MWPFKRKKPNPESHQAGPLCSNCKSTHTRVIICHSDGQPDYVRTWRGKRYYTCRCLDCGRDFYAEGPAQGLSYAEETGDQSIDNEEELQTAEAELKREVDDEGDRRCR